VRIALGPVPLTHVAAAACALEAEALEVAWLAGEGWGDATLAIAPRDERRIGFGPRALDDAAHAIDAFVAAREPFVGYVAYEAARAIERPAWAHAGGPDPRAEPTGAAAILRRYGATLRWLRESGLALIEGPDAIAVASLRRALERAGRRAHEPARGEPPTLELHPVDDDAVHRARVERALAYIAAGDLYVVNVARAFDGHTDAPPTALLASMLRRTSAPFAASIELGDHALASTSPELFLRVAPRKSGVHGELQVRTSPIKGTRPRGRDAAHDAASAAELRRDPKERAELVMIVDLERNDLGKVARIGHVRPAPAPRLLSTRTVHHLVHDVDAHVDAHVGHGAIVAAMLPSGSVTGAPKVRAMEIIAELEGARRGLYCGAIVRGDADGELVASMAIRTVVVDRRAGTARYFAGGGIVADSDPAREVAETRWKALQVTARRADGTDS
jgi:anthranilate/para-aminobenzoate synthase component I